MRVEEKEKRTVARMEEGEREGTSRILFLVAFPEKKKKKNHAGAPVTREKKKKRGRRGCLAVAPRPSFGAPDSGRKKKGDHEERLLHTGKKGEKRRNQSAAFLSPTPAKEKKGEGP